MKALFETQGGGTAIYSQQLRTHVFVAVPNWGEHKVGEPVPGTWGLYRIGLYSDAPFASMEPAEREGYIVGFEGNPANQNRYPASSEFHTEWKAGYERGCRERYSKTAA